MLIPNFLLSKGYYKVTHQLTPPQGLAGGLDQTLWHHPSQEGNTEPILGTRDDCLGPYLDRPVLSESHSIHRVLE